MKNYKLTRFLPLLSIIVTVVFLILLSVVYPKEVKGVDINSDVIFTDEKITLTLFYAYPLEKFFDYSIEYDNNILKVFIRKSILIGKNWPRIIEIKNDYPTLKEIRIMSSTGSRTIFLK